MTLSAGLGRIVVDPQASIMTRKALGRLATPGLLVTNKGITINNDGRMALRIEPNTGLAESDTGLAVQVSPVGGITLDANGLSVGTMDVVRGNSAVIANEITLGGGVGATNINAAANINGSFCLNNATPITRFLVADVVVSYSATPFDVWDWFFAFNGCKPGDIMFASPLNYASISYNVGAWSSWVVDTDYACIRTKQGPAAPVSFDLSFRAFCIGFT